MAAKKTTQDQILEVGRIVSKRPRGLATQIREHEDLPRLLSFLFDLAVGRVEGSNKDRLAAVELLYNRGFGKALETTLVAATSDGADAVAELSRDQLLRLVSGSGPVSGPEGAQVIEDAELVE